MCVQATLWAPSLLRLFWGNKAALPRFGLLPGAPPCLSVLVVLSLFCLLSFNFEATGRFRGSYSVLRLHLTHWTTFLSFVCACHLGVTPSDTGCGAAALSVLWLLVLGWIWAPGYILPSPVLSLSQTGIFL